MGLMQLDRSSLTEIMSMRQPPPVVLRIFEGLVAVLAPTKRVLDWNDVKRVLGSNANNLIAALIEVDKDQITEEQLMRLESILSPGDCAPQHIQRCSKACYGVFFWLQSLVKYAKLLRQHQPTA